MFAHTGNTVLTRALLFGLWSLLMVPSFARAQELPAQEPPQQEPPKQEAPKREQPKNEVYQGMILKLDLGATAVALGASKAQIQHYELAMNWRVIQRLYPTFEAGYAGGTRVQGDTLHYRGQGGFFRVGLDINPLKKHPESPHALLVGVRLGTAVQQIHQENDHVAAPAVHRVAADCWGEIVAGCQVNLTAGLYMGWMGRLKCLFTRVTPVDRVAELQTPVYIPGFGTRDNIGWGLSYHIGYKF